MEVVRHQAAVAGTSPGASSPRLSVGALVRTAACPRRLHHWLAPERVAGRTADGPFRLTNKVIDAVRAAHQSFDAVVGPGAPDLDAFLDRRPPPGLATEEEHRFVEAINRYADEFSDRPGVLDPRSGVDATPRPSSTGRFLYTGKPQLLVLAADGVVELRRIRIRAKSFGRNSATIAPSGIDADAATAALLRVDTLRVVELWTVGIATVTERTIGGPELAALREAVDQCVTDSDVETPRPGYWCGDCPVVGSCGAISQHTPTQVVGL